MAEDNHLVDLANAGDPAAQYAVARDLLSGEGSAESDIRQAFEWMDAASVAGNADAMTMRALFEATGAGRQQDWHQALDTLQRAAEHGSEFAGRQLLLLAYPTSEPQVPENAQTEFWTQVRRAVSLDRLFAHPDRRALSNGPPIRVMEGFASAAECRWLIDRATGMLKMAVVVDSEGRQIVDPVRTNKGAIFQFTDMDLVIEALRSRISAATRIPVALLEPTQVLHYRVGQEFKRHCDYLEPGNSHHRKQLQAHGQRIATFLLYLNDDFEGGETEFCDIGVRYRGKAGDAVFWANCDLEGRPDPRTLHAGLPPATGEKWILSQWIRDRPASAA